jgi:transposase InsO family protein
MNDIQMTELKQVEQFLIGTEAVTFTALEKRYQWVARTLKRFDYHRLRKKDKRLIIEYLLKITGYSRQQLTRLIAQHRSSSWIGRRRNPRHTFHQRYTREDILLLAQTDEYHQTLSGPATKKLFERGYSVFHDPAYERLARISSAHIYNLRGSETYLRKRRYFSKTQRSSVPIGERRKPTPQGQPGYLRIDTVHQGDQDKEKGVYHINAVDEVTQMEVVYSVEKISELYLIPVFKNLVDEFPFEIKGIHCDNGSEYINKAVAELLQKLLVEFTKSRARHSNDNALVESKNGSVIRKYMGYSHISQKWSKEINAFYKGHLNPYVNYHRPCFFPVVKMDEKGKQKKTYPYKSMMTPYDKLKSLPNAKNYLKKGMTFKQLDLLANNLTDHEAAKRTHEARSKLFKIIFDEKK